MGDNGDLRAEAQGQVITVTLRGTSYIAIYHKPIASSQLLAKFCRGKDDLRTPTTHADFLTQAWRTANDKARQLGWIK